MILQTETSLTSDEYTALLAATGDPSLVVTVEQYTPVFSLHDSDGIVGAAVDCFDAIVCGSVIVRAYRSAANTLTIDTLADESLGDESWATQNIVATDIVATVPVTLAAEGNTVHAFWYDGTNIKAFVSVDNGANWGAAWTVGAKADVIFLGAATLLRVHYLATTAYNNSRPGVAIYSGSWSLTDSIIYWPFVPDSFDAINCSPTDDGAAATSDILCMTTDFPPIIGAKIQSTELVRELNRVQGLAFLRYQNAHYSSHWEFDLIDRAHSFPSRKDIRLSSYDDLLFACYYRVEGTDDYPHTAMGLSRSKDGKFWELPYLLTATLDAPSILLKMGDYVYTLNAWKTYRAISVGYTGDVQESADVTSYLSAISVKQGTIAQCDLAIENPVGVLDALTPLASDVSLRVKLDMGYTVAGVALNIQTFLGDVDVRGGSQQVPTIEMSLASRDYLARLMTVQADQVQEWDGHVIGGDNFETGDDNTSYSGMRHTAIQDGSWKTPAGENELVLFGSLSPGVAFNTYCMDAWNGECQSGFQVGATDTEDFAGLLFRGYDKNNMLFVAYDAELNKIKLVDRKDDVDLTLAASSTKYWTSETWYWLKVRFTYSMINVYSSFDGITWKQEFAYELLGVADGTAWTWAKFADRSIPNLSGRMGYLGHGYSDYDDTFIDPPPSLPEETPAVEPRSAMVATNDGIWVTGDLLSVNPTWAELNDGLVGAGPRYIWTLVEDPNNVGEWWAGTNDGLYYNDDLLGSGTWTQLLSLANILTVVQVASPGVVGIADVRGISFCVLKTGYAALIGLTDGGDVWIIDNDSNGASSAVGDWRGRAIGADAITGAQQIAVSKHLNAGSTDIRCAIVGIANTGYIFIDDTGDTSGAWTNDVEPGSDVFPVTFWENSAYDDNAGFVSKVSENGVDMIKYTSLFLDLGPGTTYSRGDAGMTNPSDSHGVILWVSTDGAYWYVAENNDVFWTDDHGLTWSPWGDDYSGTIESIGAGDGDTERGFIVASLDVSEPVDDIIILFDPDDTGWVDRTGNLDDDSAASSGYRIYLLDEQITIPIP